MKTILVYKSRTGFTERYANWIAEELHCDICRYKELQPKTLKDYDIVIFGSRIHAGKMDSLGKIKTLIKQMAGPKLVIFATGATPAEATDILEETWRVNLPGDEQITIPHFYMQSGLNYEKMGKLDKMIMKMMAKMLSKKEDKTDNEAGCEQVITDAHDISSKEYIAPLVQYIREQE